MFDHLKTLFTKEKIVACIQSNYKPLLITFGGLILIVIAYTTLNGVIKTLIFDKTPSSEIVQPKNNEIVSSDEDVKTLVYIQSWLNYWHPYVLRDCIKNNIPVDQCVPPNTEIVKNTNFISKIFRKFCK